MSEKTGIYIIPIVEGHGEVRTVEVLLRRIAGETANAFIGCPETPIRTTAASFLQFSDEFNRKIWLARQRLIKELEKGFYQKGILLVLLDSEDNCPRELGPKILENLRTQTPALLPNCHLLVALAYREFETWFLGAANTLRGCCGLAQNANPPPDPESIRGAKEWLSRNMTSRRYIPTLHQLEMTRHFSLAEAASVPSFARLRQKLHAIWTPPNV